MTLPFKLVVKNGDQKYNFNDKTGQYTFEDVDYVEEYENLGAALLGFLEWATDTGLDRKVTVSFNPKKSKKDK